MKQRQLGKKIAAWFLCLAMMVTTINLPAFMTAVRAEGETAVTYTFLDGAPAGFSDAENPDKAVDGDLDTKWCAKFESPAYIILEASYAVQPIGYRITTGNDTAKYSGRNPKKWILYASNNYNSETKTGDWTAIDTIWNGQLPAKNNESVEFYTSDCNRRYQYFKWEIEQIAADDIIQLSEFSLLGSLCNHSFENTYNQIEPTCVKGGYDIEECTFCQIKRNVANSKPALGHDYVDGICSVCQFNTNLSNTTFATKENLVDKTQFSLWKEDGGVAQKVNFGNGKTWYIAGAQEDELVLMCDPKNTFGNSVFLESPEPDSKTIYYNKDQYGIYTVYANHYGASDIRKYLKGKESGLFTEKEKSFMATPGVYTNDINNTSSYPTNDRLYLAYGEKDKDYITVGINGESSYDFNLNKGIKIGLNDNASSGSPYKAIYDNFWLRTAFKTYYENEALTASSYAPMVDEAWVTSEHSVIPAFHLKLSEDSVDSVLFASSASAGTADATLGTRSAPNAMTFRMNGTEKVSGTAIYDNDGVKVTKVGDDEYIYIQYKDNAGDHVWSKAITGDMNIYRDCLGVDSFKNCKIWIEKKNDRENLTYAVMATYGKTGITEHSYAIDSKTENQHICQVCGMTEKHNIPANAEVIIVDKNQHGKECSVCHEIIPTGTHDFSDDAGKCKVCDVCKLYATTGVHDFLDEGICKGCGAPKPDYLTFTAEEEPSSVTINYVSGSVNYSRDGGISWSTCPSGTTIDLAIGESVCLKGKNIKTYWDENQHFSMTGKIKASGSVTSLTDENGADPNVELPLLCYVGMFYNCAGLTKAPSLPATTLSYACYFRMFEECTGLTQAPKLPAITLDEMCYASMFFGCANLTKAPSLPATTLDYKCYECMFYDCKGLTEAPKLPAMTLAKECYGAMFIGCTSLTTAPELPARTLADACYQDMFYECDNITNISISCSVKSSDIEDIGVDLSKVTLSIHEFLDKETGKDNLETCTFCETKNINAPSLDEKVSVEKLKYIPETPQSPTVTIDGLVENTDFTVGTVSETNIGKYTVTVTGIGKYAGTRTVEWTIGKADPSYDEPEAVTIACNQSLKDVDLPENFAFVDENAALKVGEDNTVKVIYTPDDTDTYNVVEDTMTVTVAAHKFDGEDTADKYKKSEATCVDKAVYYHKCSVCGEKGTTTFAAGEVDESNHTPAVAVKENEVAPTCETAGSYDSVVYCSSCTKKLSSEENTVDALGHHLKKVDQVDATCKSTGMKAYYVCDREGCGTKFADEAGETKITDESTLVIAKDPAKHGDNTEIRNDKIATCVNPGYTGDTYCKDCDTKLADGEEIAATGVHSYAFGTCVMCKKAFSIVKDGLVYTIVTEEIENEDGSVSTVPKEVTTKDSEGEEVTSVAVSVKADQDAEVKGAITIPAIVTNEDEPFVVVAVEENAFADTKATSITLPETIAKVGANAFASETITEVAFTSVNAPTIDEKAFVGSNVTKVTVPEGAKNYDTQEALKSETITVEEKKEPAKDPEQKPDSTTQNPNGSTETPADDKKPGTTTETPADDKKPGTTTETPVDDKKPGITTEVPAKTGDTVKDDTGVSYTVADVDKKTVVYTAPANKNVKSVKVPDTVTINDVTYTVTEIAANAFSGCTKLKSVTISKNVVKIGNNAFKNCKALTKLTLPAKVAKIGANAFSGCKKLKTLTIKNKKLKAKDINKKAFKGLTKKTTIKVPKKQMKSYKKMFKKKGLSSKVKVKA